MGLLNRFRKNKAETVTTPVSTPAVAPAAAYVPRASDLTVGDYANGIPNIKLGAMFASFVKQLVWVVPLFLIGCVVAWFLTADFKRTYTGESTIMVQLGDEYVYQSASGNTNSSLLQTPDTIALNEIAIIKNPEVIDRVLGEIQSSRGGLEAFAPDIAEKMAQHREGSTPYQLAYMELRKKVTEDFMVAARPKSSVIDMAYRHENPQLSVSTMNRLMDSYLAYRRALFVEGTGDTIAQRRADTEQQLAQNERRITAFLERNNISDFESEQEGAQERTEDLKATLNTLRADMSETERSLAVVEDQLRQTPETINLYVDDRASNRIAQAELELKQLLAKYLPTSDPVQQKQREIDELRALQRANGGQAAGGRRVGPNPVFQELLTRRNTLQATANSQREKEYTIQQQLNSVDAKLRRMTNLSPEYMDLLRSRETLNTRLTSYLTREQEALVSQAAAESSAENVRVISRATYPVKGRNMRKLMFALAAMGWLFTLLMFALFRVFTDPRLYMSAADRQASAPRDRRHEDEAGHIPEPVQPYAPTSPDEHRPAAYEPAAQPNFAGRPQDTPYPEQVTEDRSSQYASQSYKDTAPNYDGGPQEWVPPQSPQQPAISQDYSNPYLSGASAAPLDPPTHGYQS